MGIYGDGNQCWGWKVGHTPATSAMDKIPSARLEAPLGYCPDYNHIQSIAVCLTVLPSRCDLVFASSFSDSTKSHYDSHRWWSNPSNFGCGKGLFSRRRQPFFRWAWQSLIAVILVPQVDTRHATFRHAHSLLVRNSIPFITDDKSSWERLTAAKTFIQWWISCQPFHFGS